MPISVTNSVLQTTTGSGLTLKSPFDPTVGVDDHSGGGADGIVTPDELRERRGYFLELLKSPDEEVRLNSWCAVDDLIEAGILAEDEVVEMKGYYLELLKSKDEEVRWQAWDSVGGKWVIVGDLS